MSQSQDAAGRSARSRGFGRVLIMVYGIFALAATARSAVQLITRGSEAPLAYGLSAFSAVVYLVATTALASRGRLAYLISWITIIIELVGVIVIGAASVLYPEIFARDTVWSRFGMGYGFIPLILPIIGMIWLRRVGQ